MGNCDIRELAVDGARLAATIRQYAEIGATSGGGVTRLALSDEDRAARDLLAGDLAAIGCNVFVDDLGNMRGVFRSNGGGDASPVVIASHLDSVVRGGRFDGALGVLGGLEVLRTLRAAGVKTERPIELVNWTNEEGARFEPAMLGSGATTGVFQTDWMLARTDPNGRVLAEELERIGYRGDVANRPALGAAYLELHIEQGPVLDDLDQPVGVVEGILGITWIEIVVTGRSAHAGPTPMSLRNDALVAAAGVVQAVREIGAGEGVPAVGTVGRLDVEPNVLNTIPGTVRLGADLRAKSKEQLDRMFEALESRCQELARAEGVEIVLDRFWTIAPTPFDEKVMAAIDEACAAVGVEPVRLWSGAGHDAKYAADVMPAGMIFVRSRGGVSHCEEEFSTDEDIALGANVLLQAALSLAAAH
jgi:N-carbamoyl-L-amino-acid hydrolase